MNQKTKTALQNAWDEPRRFFLWLALFSIAALGLGYVININTHNYTPSPFIESFGWVCAAIFATGAIFGIVGFLLSWIPPVHRFFVWLLRRRFFLLACLVTLIAFFYAEENWRGKRAWEKYQRQQEAKGERFDLKGLAPSPVPDDENFAMAPIWVEAISAQMGAEKAARWYGKTVAALGHTNFARTLDMPVEIHLPEIDLNSKTAGWSNAEKFDLKRWQEYYRDASGVTNFFPVAPRAQTPAEDVLLALSKYDLQIENLRRAARLPHSRFPIGYLDDNPTGILLPHLAVLKGSTTTLQLRAIAEMQAGQAEKSLEDVKLMLRLIDSIRSEPILISHLVRISMHQIVLQPVWEGLAAHAWNDGQLAALDAEFAKLDFLADYNFTMRGERAFGVGVIDYIQRDRRQMMNMFAQVDDPAVANPLEKLPARLIPSGWFEQNKVSIMRMHSTYLLPIVNIEARTVSVSAQRRAAHASENLRLNPYNCFSRLLLPAISNIPVKSGRAQSTTDLARLAIALERHRLEYKRFPETLDALAPRFLKTIPHDVISGEPLHYRLTDGGNFILYSVGWNKIDDDGKTVLTKGSTPSVDVKKGDWVWQYPPN